jgi:putative ABC transport system permease protein
MVRGRLSAINGTAAESHLSLGSPGRRAITRELNLTWSDQLAPDNRIESGRWWQEEDAGHSRISLEIDLAKDLGVHLGDSLTFSFGEGRSIEAEITSLRSLDWGSLRPNFYVIFAPGTLDPLPASYITSFHLPAERSRELIALMQQFPNLTLLEVDQLLTNLRTIVAQVSLAVEYVMLFVLMAGITVLYAALYSGLDARLYEGALLRTLGARTRFLRRMLWLEYGLLGLFSGLLGAALSEAVAFWLYEQLFGLEHHFSVLLWLLTPLSGALLVGIAGAIGTSPIINQSPLRVLRAL